MGERIEAQLVVIVLGETIACRNHSVQLAWRGCGKLDRAEFTSLS
jgi:hypothetical protein